MDTRRRVLLGVYDVNTTAGYDERGKVPFRVQDGLRGETAMLVIVVRQEEFQSLTCCVCPGALHQHRRPVCRDVEAGSVRVGP